MGNKPKKYDFAGWATRSNVKCEDGRTILEGAFKDQDGVQVPLIYNHDHDHLSNVIGHAILEHRQGGMYAYCVFNDTDMGKLAKSCVNNRDLNSLSIFANKLKQSNGNVIHGKIRELSLVLAGANPGAKIDEVVEHNDDNAEGEFSAYIFNNSEELELYHGETEEDVQEMTPNENDDIQHSEDGKEKTVEDVYNSFTEEQKQVAQFLIGTAVEEATKENGKDKEGKETMKHNAFDENEQEINEEESLKHDAMVADAINDAPNMGSMKASFIKHGITNIDYLFPDATTITKTPQMVNIHPRAWVTKVMNSVHRSPIARIRFIFADITADEARAKGYIKGNEKTDEIFNLIKRELSPQTVYKKQSFHRDDLIDITFDLIPWIKTEMRLKLDEELARAILFGDGRDVLSPDKIKEDKIMPIIKDTASNFYGIKVEVAAPEKATAEEFADDTVLAMASYEGSGDTTLYMKQTAVAKMLTARNRNGDRYFKNMDELATALSVKSVEPVPDAIVPTGYYGVAVDLDDYYVGADKGGAINLFDDFDIDYNKEKYLIETRCSGGLAKYHAAVVLAVKTEQTPSNEVQG